MIFYQSRNFFENEERFAPLFINSCGHFVNVISENGVKRYQGRDDYQLIYILKGFIRFSFKDEEPIDVSKGNLVLFKPYEPQVYCYPSQNGAEYVWIHFGGELIESLLKGSGLYDKNCCFIPGCESSVHIIEKMMSEIKDKQPSYQIKLMGLFCSLLSDIAHANDANFYYCLHSRLAPALEEIECNPQNHHTLDEYASMCHITKYHFIREFKKLKNQSPIQYRDSVCMKRAASLLEFTDMSICQISESLGIDDPLYFSKKFKRHFGISPTEYKKTH